MSTQVAVPWSHTFHNIGEWQAKEVEPKSQSHFGCLMSSLQRCCSWARASGNLNNACFTCLHRARLNKGGPTGTEGEWEGEPVQQARQEPLSPEEVNCGPSNLPVNGVLGKQTKKVQVLGEGALKAPLRQKRQYSSYINMVLLCPLYDQPLHRKHLHLEQNPTSHSLFVFWGG